MFIKTKTVKTEHRKYKGRKNKEIYDAIMHKDKVCKEERIHYLEVISDHLALPPDIIAGAPIITVHGRNTICIENQKKILEYTDCKIKILTKIGGLCIEGKHLVIVYCTKDELKIAGYIFNISYIQGS